jgi:hypothetical protein
MRTQLPADTVAPLHKTHTIRLRFDNTPENQALYAALSASSDHECRTPLPRQIRYLLGMAMGLIQPDLFMLKRLGYSSVDPYEFAANASAAYVPPPPTRPPTTLHLIPGGAEAVKPEQR